MRAHELEPTIRSILDGGWGDRRAELTFYSQHPQCRVLVALSDDASRSAAQPRGADGGDIVGTTLLTASATVGWVGLVFVAPSMRGRGLGTTLTRAGLADLEASGCRSFLLAASQLGRPIYERLGFVAEGTYTRMRGPSRTGELDARVRPITPADVEKLAALDRRATGEDRAHLLRALPHGYCTEGGYALRRPSGLGPVIAESQIAGELLLDALLTTNSPAEVAITIPDANLAAKRHLTEAGLEPVATLPRMRLGDPVAWHPEKIWAIFNFALG